MQVLRIRSTVPLYFISSFLSCELLGLLLFLEAVYVEFHYACHEKFSLRCPLQALTAFTCANGKEISWRVLFHVGHFDRYEISCRGYN